MATHSQANQLMDTLSEGEAWPCDGTLTRNGPYSIQTVLDKEALNDAGVDVEDPGDYTGRYYPHRGVMILDLGGEFFDE